MRGVVKGRSFLLDFRRGCPVENTTSVVIEIFKNVKYSRQEGLGWQDICPDDYTE